MDARRSKSEREAKDKLEKDGGEGKKQGGLEELGSSQSSSTGVLVGKRDSLMGLLARPDMIMVMILLLKDRRIPANKSIKNALIFIQF